MKRRLSMIDTHYIIGKVVGNKGRQVVLVEGLDLEIYEMDRYSAIRQLPNGMQLFILKDDTKKLSEKERGKQ